MSEPWHRPYWGHVFGRTPEQPLGWHETLGNFGRLSGLLLYAELLFPKTLVVEDVVFLCLGGLDDKFTATRVAAVKKTREMTASAASDYISSFNWVDIDTLFRSAYVDNLTDEDY
jgi:hypothetical protein